LYNLVIDRAGRITETLRGWLLLRINGKTKIVVFSAAGVVILLLAAWLALFRERRPTYEAILTPDRRIDHPSVLNLETGEMVPIETAILDRVPYVGVMNIREKQTLGNLWTALTSPEYTYTVSLRISGVDFDFAPAGRVLHDYWADKNGSKWPAILPHQTSSYAWTVTPEDQDRRILFRTFAGTTGVLRISAMDESNARLRCRIVAKAPSGATAARDGGEPSLARWPEGAAVQIVGISRHPSAASQWWTADGSLLTRPPGLVQGQFVPYQNDMAAYEVAYRFLGLDRELIHGIGARVPGSPGMTYVPAKDEFGNPCYDCAVRAFLFSKEAQTAVIEFGAATGQWQTILATRDGSEVAQDDSSMVRISSPEQTQSGVAVTLTFSRAWTDNYAWRLFAVGPDGGRREVRMVSKDTGPTESSPFEQYRFNTEHRLSDIKEFRFDVCPYRWLRFKNVSLRPEQNFNVQIEPPAPQTPAPPGEGGS
jgi:hypothetical protein